MEVLLRAVCFLILFGIYLTSDDLFVILPFETNPLPECPPNEMFKYCLNNCTNCEQRGVCCSRKERGICLSIDCSHKGCDCIPQYFRLKPGGPCEPVGKCPIPECGENELFRECGPIFEHCNAFHSKSLQCDHKCYCKEGYKRDAEDKCIPEDECPAKSHCPRNEELLDIGPVDEYCMHEEFAEVSNSTMNKTQCYCKEGFKRNAIGHCTHEKFCPTSCYNNEVYQNCPRKCNSTCWNYADPDCEEDGQCYPGCFCPEGLLMNSFRTCVTLENCPPGSNPYAPTAAPEVEVTIPDSVSASSLEEGATTTPSSDSPNDSGETTPENDDFKPEEDEAITEDAEEDSEDENVTEMIEGLEDEDIPVTTRSPPKISPTKRPRIQKNQPSRNPKGGTNTFTRVSVKSEKAKPSSDDEDEFADNEWL